MSAFTRSVFKPLASLIALMLGTPAEPSPRLPAMSMPSLMQRLREDASVRRRFARDPEGLLREAAIDPAAFNLPPRIDETWLDRFLADWGWPAGPRASPPLGSGGPLREALDSPPEAVSGTPPASRNPPPSPRPSEPLAVKPPPPAPAYGPPGGVRRWPP